MSDRPGAYLELSLVGPPARPPGWHPYDQPPIYWVKLSETEHVLLRPRADNTLETVAACTTAEAVFAAGRLFSGVAYYPIWRAQQAW